MSTQAHSSSPPRPAPPPPPLPKHTGLLLLLLLEATVFITDDVTHAVTGMIHSIAVLYHTGFSYPQSFLLAQKVFTSRCLVVGIRNHSPRPAPPPAPELTQPARRGPPAQDGNSTLLAGQQQSEPGLPLRTAQN